MSRPISTPRQAIDDSEEAEEGTFLSRDFDAYVTMLAAAAFDPDYSTDERDEALNDLKNVFSPLADATN